MDQFQKGEFSHTLELLTHNFPYVGGGCLVQYEDVVQMQNAAGGVVVESELVVDPAGDDIELQKETPGGTRTRNLQMRFYRRSLTS